jgi:putative NADPH-quinone reductase
MKLAAAGSRRFDLRQRRIQIGAAIGVSSVRLTDASALSRVFDLAQSPCMRVRPCSRPEPRAPSAPGTRSMSSRILVLDGHPDPDRSRFCHALAEAYIAGARSAGKETRLLTISELNVPLLRTDSEFAAPPNSPEILRARDDLLWCDHVVIIFPLWLGGAPSLLRAFFEQLARGGFVAETSGRGIRQKLKGRSARLIVTMGMPSFIYSLMFREHGVRNIMQGVLGFGGIAPVRRTFFGGVETAGAHVQQARLAKVRQLGCDGV